jgi:hypothetical protein
VPNEFGSSNCLREVPLGRFPVGDAESASRRKTVGVVNYPAKPWRKVRYQGRNPNAEYRKKAEV